MAAPCSARRAIVRRLTSQLQVRPAWRLLSDEVAGVVLHVNLGLTLLPWLSVEPQRTASVSVASQKKERFVYYRIDFVLPGAISLLQD